MYGANPNYACIKHNHLLPMTFLYIPLLANSAQSVAISHKSLIYLPAKHCPNEESHYRLIYFLYKLLKKNILSMLKSGLYNECITIKGGT